MAGYLRGENGKRWGCQKFCVKAASVTVVPGSANWMANWSIAFVHSIARRNPQGPRLVAPQPVEAFRHEPFADFRGASLAHDLVGTDAIGGPKEDLGPPDMLLGTVAVPGHRFQAAAHGGRNNERDACAYPTDSHTHLPRGS